MPVQLAVLARDEEQDSVADPLADERSLVEACQRGDRTALELIYADNQQAMLGVAMRMLGRREDAEDAVHTAVVKLFRSIGGYRFDARISTYVMRILINVCYDMIEAGKKRRDLTIEPTPVRQPQTDLRLQLEQAILTLPERMRACFVLFAVEGVPQKDIADMLQISVGTVKAQIFQAKQRLQSLLGDAAQETTT